jgi:hypothetical protein
MSVAALVAALGELTGVEQARVEPDDTGGWGVLQLALSPHADDGAVATAVGHLLRERFGLGVDTAAVALVEDVQPMAPVSGMAVQSLQMSTAADDLRARVVLRHGARRAEASASGGSGADALVNLVAEATLRAAAQLDDELAGVRLDRVQLGSTVDGPVVRVVLSGSARGESRRLVGRSALVGDPRQAAARAVLRAVAPGAATGAATG